MNTLLPVIIEEQKTDLESKLKDWAIKATSPVTATKAAHALRDVKQAQKDLEASRKSLTKPLDDEKKDIMTAFKPLEQKLLEIETALKSTLLDWDKEQKRIEAEKQAEIERKAKEEEEKAKALLEEAAKKAEEDWDFEESERIKVEQSTLKVCVPIIPTKKHLAGGMHTRKYFKFEVIDFDLLPQEFKKVVVDEDKLISLAKDSEGRAKVEGVRFWAEETVIPR